MSELNAIQNANLLAGDLNGGDARGRAAPSRNALVPPAKIIAPFPSYRLDINVLALLGAKKLAGGFHDVGTEGARQSFVATDHQQQNIFLFAASQQRMARLAGFRADDL